MEIAETPESFKMKMKQLECAYGEIGLLVLVILWFASTGRKEGLTR